MAEKPDINPAHLKIVTDILHECLPQDVTVWTFGSRAKWTAKEFSDLDLALESKNGGRIPTDIIARLDDDFEESDLPWKVDVVDINAVAPSFKEIIIRDRVKLEVVSSGNDFITDIIDFNPTRKIQKGEIAPFVDMASLPTNARDITNISKKTFKGGGAKFKNGDTLLARITPCLENGKTAQVKGLPDGVNAFGSTEFIVMAAKQKSDENFVYYLARHPEFRSFSIARMEGTSGRQRVPWQSLVSYPKSLPDKNNRKKIGYVLKTFDDKIELNQRMNKTLEEMAQAIFKCWFVDFEPTRAKIAQKEGGGESDADICTRLKITPEILSLFPDTLTDSELGEIPEGWEVSTTEDEVDIYGGSTPSTKNDTFWKGGTFYWSTPKDLSNITSPVLLNTDRKITEAGVNKITSGQLPKGALLMSSRAPVGYLAIAEMPISINQGYIAMVCRKSLSNIFMLFWAKDNMDMIKSYANGSTFQEISKKSFRPLPLLVPTRNILTEFEIITRTLYENMVINLRQNDSLSQIRDTLLPKLLSGKISVGKTENIVEDVL